MSLFAPTFWRRVAATAGFAALLGAAAPASANVVLNYTDFTGACGVSLTCVGSTAVSSTALRLTPATTGQGGAGFSTTAITLGTGATFSTTFQFRMTNAGGIAPADGITFVLSKASSGLGTSGGGLGYQGVGQSVAIEFDTYNNGEVGGSNHVAVDVNGSLASLITASPYNQVTCDFGGGNYTRQGCMSNGNLWTATITYNGSLLDVYLQEQGQSLLHLINGYAIDIASFLGTTSAYVGFTAATGAGYENQDILQWTLANDVSIRPPGTVPEPASLALASLALLGLGVARRARR